MKTQDAPFRATVTPVAIFAGIVETVGLIVMPSFDASLRETFLWFLMAFPVLVVLLLLLTAYVGVPYGRRRQEAYGPNEWLTQAEGALHVREGPLLPEGAQGVASEGFTREGETQEAKPARREVRVP